VDQSSENFFVQRWRDGSRSNLSSIFGMSIRSRDIRGQTLKLPEIMPNFELKWVNICACNFFVSGPKFTNFFAKPSKDRPRSSLFLIFNIAFGS